MARIPFASLLLLVSLAAVACRSAGKRGGKEQVASPAPRVDLPRPSMLPTTRMTSVDYPLTLRPLEGAAVRGVRDRAAVLVCADSYRELPTYDMPQLQQGVARLRDTLVQTCAMPADAVALESGASVIPQEIEGAISAFGEEASGTSALLLVFYTGHGLIDGDGQLQLFTHYTDRDGESFRNTIPRTDLVRWASAARSRARARGVELDVVLVVDACRTPTLSARPRAKLVRAETWELYSTAEGELADAPQARATPFVTALCDGLSALAARGEADLRTTFGEVTRRLREADGKQTPQLVAADDGNGPRIVLPGRARVGLRVVDLLGDTVLYVGDEDVLADGKPLPREGDFFVLETTVDRAVQLQVRTAGYLPYTRSLSITAQENGKAFAVPLRPEFVRVRGRVAPPVAVEVEAVFDDERVVPRAGYHETRQYTGINQPEFELLLPRPREGSTTRVLAKQFDRQLAQAVVDFAAAAADPQLDGVRVVDLGTLQLEGADTGALALGPDVEAASRMAAAAFEKDQFGGILPPPQFVAPTLQQPTFVDSFQRIRWEEALTAFQAGDLRLARTHLQTLQQSLRGAPDDSVTNLLGHVEVRLAMDAPADDDILEQIAAAKPPDGPLAMGLRSMLAARKLRRASELAATGDLEAIGQLREAAMLEPDTDTPYATQARKRIDDLRWSIGATLLEKLNQANRHDDIVQAMQLLRADDPEAWNHPDWSRLEQRWSVPALLQYLQEGLDLGKANGDWTRADDAIDLRRNVFPGDAPQQLLDLEAAIARDRGPPWVPETFRAAQQAQSAGRLDEAIRLLGKAREGANTHWRGQIDELDRTVREQVFREETRRAAESRTAGDVAGALDASLRACLAMGKLSPDVRDLLRRDPQQAARPEVASVLAEIDAAQLAAARASRSRRAWQDYADDHPNGAGAEEARAMLARMANPWQRMSPPAQEPAMARYGHAMAYDETRGIALVFGGTRDGSAGLNDTWAWNGQAWQQLDPPSRPPARAFHALAYDPVRRNLLLMGGTTDGGETLLDDTWLWDGSTWRAVEGPRPPARCKHAMAFDAERGRMVLYGGEGLRDTWEWDGERWLDVSPRKTNPGKLVSPAMAYSRTERRVVLMGGDGRDGITWYWDGRNWVSNKRTGVSGSEGGTMVAAGDRLLRFGGEARAFTDDLLTYANGAWGLTRMGAPPPPRMWHASAFDSKRNMLIVHGGLAAPKSRRQPAQVHGDTWEFVVEP